jgi:predicted phosphodiesterase
MMRVHSASLALVLWASAMFAQGPISWVQLGPDRSVLARAVLEGRKECPSIVLDGRVSLMQPRTPTPAGFPVVCEASIRPETRTASIEGQRLALPTARFEQIAVIGDTGCRVRVRNSTGDTEIQNCKEEWPFKPLADAAAAKKPDLVIHTGDYVYRESEGFQWKTWYADFFQPANRLLHAAPWIFVRGNHESCEDGGIGWFYLLDPRPYEGACKSEFSEAYVVNAGSMPFVVLDSSAAEELSSKRRQVNEYAAQLKRVNAASVRGAWVLTHQPFWAFRRESGDTKRGELDTVNDTLQTVWREAPLPNAALVVSGHIHLFQALSFGDGRPPQIVTGNSGTELARRIRGPFEGRKIARTTVAHSAVIRKHGFTQLTRREKNWQLTVHGLKGKEVECLLAGSALSCQP